VPNSAVWSPDGNYIFYPQNIDGGSVLWQITLDGKNPKEVYNSKVPICSLSIHPNGQKIVMTTLDQGAEIWKVDKLLSNDETVDK
jgi:Tol biopolymer transport system component